VVWHPFRICRLRMSQQHQSAVLVVHPVEVTGSDIR
jgi:hypothetical protein